MGDQTPPGGQKPPAQTPTGQQPAGQKPAGQKPPEEKQIGQKPSEQKPIEQKPAGQKQPPQAQSQPEGGKQVPAQKPPGQGRPAGQRPAQGQTKAVPGRRPAAEPRSRKKEILLMPFVLFFFLFGLVNLLATPVVYTYEVIAYNKKDEWPGWSGLDGLNYLFSGAKLQVYKDILYHGNPPLPVVHIPMLQSLAGALNDVLVGYLSWSAVFLCLLQGIVFLTLSIRTSILVLGN